MFDKVGLERSKQIAQNFINENIEIANPLLFKAQQTGHRRVDWDSCRNCSFLLPCEFYLNTDYSATEEKKTIFTIFRLHLDLANLGCGYFSHLILS